MGGTAQATPACGSLEPLWGLAPTTRAGPGPGGRWGRSGLPDPQPPP